MQQITIDFSGKKTEKITISASEDLKHTLGIVAHETGKEVSVLACEYVAECAARDFGKLMILQARGKVSINMAQL
jgi:hypothetical protein